jgi:hypothetical protein
MNSDNKMLEYYIFEFDKFNRDIMKELYLKLSQELSKFIPEINENNKEFIKLYSQISEEIKKELEKFPPYIKNAVYALGRHGWYLDIRGMPIPFVVKIYSMIKNDDIHSAEVLLEEYFERKVNQIEGLTINKFPERSEILKAAFGAHNKGEYILSIPVILAQVDGICFTKLEKYLFIKDHGKPGTAILSDKCKTDSLSNAIHAAILLPLSQPLPINYSVQERNQDFTELNRHMVLHGESLNYGTKTNSLKTISLLNYITQVLEE